MTLQRVWFAVLMAAMLVAGSTMWTPRAIPAHVPVSPVSVDESTPTPSVIDSASRALPAEDERWLEPRVDLNGNEIDAAVSDYRVDPRGEMYERHAPDTALLRLSAPKL